MRFIEGDRFALPKLVFHIWKVEAKKNIGLQYVGSIGQVVDWRDSLFSFWPQNRPSVVKGLSKSY